MALPKTAIPENLTKLSVISGFCRDVDEICALLGHYEASLGKPLPTCSVKLSLTNIMVR
jgi:hypothetical protein